MSKLPLIIGVAAAVIALAWIHMQDRVPGSGLPNPSDPARGIITFENFPGPGGKP